MLEFAGRRGDEPRAWRVQGLQAAAPACWAKDTKMECMERAKGKGRRARAPTVEIPASPCSKRRGMSCSAAPPHLLLAVCLGKKRFAQIRCQWP